eukprot:CAMPEP_0182417670 /NCGR_PEP_ID=MMETSP1167-20130531/2110_1 /TAXON_ID=2988 /ORGANISM="Mallomonas Sp, Strain CCMP3275" /LENGTH=766 /DNA_ID=CAMNT_0024591377 /DNA_START=105 /DNA_END=2405 /DNA_ORIENTATION=-
MHFLTTLGCFIFIEAFKSVSSDAVSCINFVLSSGEGWASSKLRLVGKNGLHDTYQASSDQSIETQYCFNAATNADGDVLIAGVYGLDSEQDAPQVSWTATDSNGVSYVGQYMTFLTFEYHIENGDYWTTLRESHNVQSVVEPTMVKSHTVDVVSEQVDLGNETDIENGSANVESEDSADESDSSETGAEGGDVSTEIEADTAIEEMGDTDTGVSTEETETTDQSEATESEEKGEEETEVAVESQNETVEGELEEESAGGVAGESEGTESSEMTEENTVTEEGETDKKADSVADKEEETAKEEQEEEDEVSAEEETVAVTESQSEMTGEEEDKEESEDAIEEKAVETEGESESVQTEGESAETEGESAQTEDSVQNEGGGAEAEESVQTQEESESIQTEGEGESAETEGEAAERVDTQSSDVDVSESSEGSVVEAMEAVEDQKSDSDEEEESAKVEKWTLQGSISLCGFNEEFTKEQAALISTVITDTLNAASTKSDVQSEDVSILFWESTASPDDISDSTRTHKIIFTAYIYPQSFGYAADQMDEEMLSARIAEYIQTSIDSGMFMEELSDLALQNNAGSFCGIKEAGMMTKMASTHARVVPYVNPYVRGNLYSEFLGGGIIVSALVIIGVMSVIARRLFKQVHVEEVEPRVEEPPLYVSETIHEHDHPTLKIEAGLWKPEYAAEKKEKTNSNSIVTNHKGTFTAPRNIHDELPKVEEDYSYIMGKGRSTSSLKPCDVLPYSIHDQKVNNKPTTATPYTINFETTM